jgi:type II secretory pathway pseudopilin PulG
MRLPSRRRGKQRAGLTLLELAVVLVILVALAGIVVPLLPNIIDRTHTAAGTANVAEVNKWLQYHAQTHNRYPDGWDSLTAGTTIAPYIPGARPGETSLDLTTDTLTTAEWNALNAAGIMTVYRMDPTLDETLTPPQSPTFNPYELPLTPLTTTDRVVMLTPVGASKVVRDTPAEILATGQENITSRFVVLGLGSRNTMIGKSATEAPLHFPESSALGPHSVYNRFGVVFQVSRNANGTQVPLTKAALIGAISFHSNGIVTGGNYAAQYYDAVRSSQ